MIAIGGDEYESVINCHGVTLQPEEAEPTGDEHQILLEKVEDEYYAHMDHDMSKGHYISFMAAGSLRRFQIIVGKYSACAYPLGPLHSGPGALTPPEFADRLC
ncbi:MAG: hypothetical protein HUJ69_02335 [Lachnospiraceae bacterium]|nr:hypothetical protein [Lachnospiraceae bacterium]